MAKIGGKIVCKHNEETEDFIKFITEWDYKRKHDLLPYKYCPNCNSKEDIDCLCCSNCNHAFVSICPICRPIKATAINIYCECGYHFEHETHIRNLITLLNISNVPVNIRLNDGDKVYMPDFSNTTGNKSLRKISSNGMFIGTCNLKPEQENVKSFGFIYKNHIIAFKEDRIIDYVPLELILKQAEMLYKKLKEEENRIQEEVKKKIRLEKQTKQTTYRYAQCYSCKSYLDNTKHPVCTKCGWIKCNCGACGCNRRYTY